MNRIPDLDAPRRMRRREGGIRFSLLLPILCLLPLAAQTGAVANPQFDELVRRADQARDADRGPEAEALYRQALALRPTWAEGWWSLGTLLYDRDSYQPAAEAFQRAVALNPRAPEPAAMLGLCQAALGDDKAALSSLEHARELGAARVPALRRVVLFTLGSLYLANGRFGQAQAALDVLARESPAGAADSADEERLTLALGQSVLGLLPGDPAAADPATRALILRAGLAERLAARSEIAAAQRAYVQLAADAPSLHNVQFALGRFLADNHEDEAAVAAFRKELDHSPRHLLARLGIAGVLVATDAAAALPYAEQAVEMSPTLGEAHYLLGLALLGTGETQRALEELQLADHLDPRSSKTCFALARAFAALDRKADAERARNRFVELTEIEEARQRQER